MRARKPAGAALAAALALLSITSSTAQAPNDPQAGTSAVPGADALGTENLMREPLSGNFPGPFRPTPDIENPYAGDPGATRNGMRHFTNFNCAGCHAPNGGGGMGPSLSNSKFVYGGRPVDIFMSIHQGRPKGMPAWGRTLPEKTIWELVAYIESISKEPSGPWGKTTSRVDPEAPKIEQVPFEFLSTIKPWDHTLPFSYGQRPLQKVKKR